MQFKTFYWLSRYGIGANTPNMVAYASASIQKGAKKMFPQEAIAADKNHFALS